MTESYHRLDLSGLAPSLYARGTEEDVIDAVCRAYELKQNGAAQQASERVWRVPTEQGDMAVKIYGADQQSRAEKEVGLIAHLQAHADSRFRVQALQVTAAGANRWEGLGRQAMVTRWDLGQFKSYDTFTPAEWDALGASLAALHLKLDLLELPVQDTIKARLFAIDVDETRRGLAGYRERATRNIDGASPLRTYADICLRLIDQYYPGSVASFPPGDFQHPIHNDYNQFNYLFGNTLPPLILDWEASIGAPREYELVRCLNHLPLESPALASVFVRAYLRVRPLRPERMAWAVDTACLQHALKRWVLQGWLDDPSRFAAHLRGAIDMASMMDGARERLISFFSRCLDPGT
jgi:hypothetical protein